MNLPTVPITDLTIRNNDLVASTQGRSFWILDDLTPLHQYTNRIKKSKMHFFNPRPSYRVSGSSSPSKTIGQNPPNGAVFHFYLKDKLIDNDKFSLEILYKNKIIRTISNKKGDKAKVFDGSYQTKTINPKKGMNKFVWDLKNDDLVKVSDVSFYGSYSGYKIGPGKYTARFTLNNEIIERNFEIKNDPRLDISDQAILDHQQLMSNLYDKINELHSTIVKARNIRTQISTTNDHIKDMSDVKDLKEAGEKAIQSLNGWEGNVIQTKMVTFQDVVNFLNKLNSHMINLLSTMSQSDAPLTQGQRDRYNDLSKEWDDYRNKFEMIITNEVRSYNDLYNKAQLPAVIIPD